MRVQVPDNIGSTKQLIKDLNECMKHVEESMTNTICEVFNHICRILQIRVSST